MARIGAQALQAAREANDEARRSRVLLDELLVQSRAQTRLLAAQGLGRQDLLEDPARPGMAHPSLREALGEDSARAHRQAPAGPVPDGERRHRIDPSFFAPVAASSAVAATGGTGLGPQASAEEAASAPAPAAEQDAAPEPRPAPQDEELAALSAEAGAAVDEVVDELEEIIDPGLIPGERAVDAHGEPVPDPPEPWDPDDPAAAAFASLGLIELDGDVRE